MYNVEFKDDVFLFEVHFDFKQGEPGDGYLQPDDNNYFKIIGTYMTAYITEDGEVLKLNKPADVTYIINEMVMEKRDEAIEKQIECYIK